MRLPKASQIKSIIQSFDPNAEVYLFGSRTDDKKMGGDIDLLIHSSIIDLGMKIQILQKMYDLIGEQKIDLIITPDLKSPFHRQAVQAGIRI